MVVHKKYILASSSRSRYRILKNSGFIFKQVNPTCSEENIKKQILKLTKKPSLVAKKLSYEKAMSISKKQKYSNHYVIGCDTLIYLNNKIFDKAQNIEQAKKKLKQLSGKKHSIVSGLTLCRNGNQIFQLSSTTNVKIRKLTTAEISKYLKTTGKQILNSVGCYQVESFGPKIIEDIKGDFFNVMGLPLFKLLKKISVEL